MRRKIIKYLADKQGVAPADLRFKEDGRFDFMGDLDGVLACVRKPKEKKGPPARKPKQPKAAKVPKEKKPKTAPKKRMSNLTTRVKTPSPSKQSLKLVFARKDRATMSWTPRGSEPSAACASEVTGASLLLSLAACSETVSPFKKRDESASVPPSVTTESEKSDVHGDENIVNAQSPPGQSGCQSIHAPIESVCERVRC